MITATKVKCILLFYCVCILWINLSLGQESSTVRSTDTTVPQRPKLMFYVIAQDEEVSSNYLVPIIKRELQEMTEMDGSKYFDEIVDFNKLVQSDIIGDQIIKIFKQNTYDISNKTIYGDSINIKFQQYLKKSNLLLTIEVNKFLENLEYQFYLYDVNSEDSAVVLDLYKNTLTSKPKNYQNAVVTSNDFNRELKIALRKLFPESNKNPQIYIKQNDQIMKRNSFFAKQSDTLKLEALVIDEDNNLDEITYSWQVNNQPGIEKEKNLTVITSDIDSLLIIKLRVSDGISSMDDSLKITLIGPPNEPQYFPNSYYYLDDFSNRFFRSRSSGNFYFKKNQSTSFGRDVFITPKEYSRNFRLVNPSEESNIKIFYNNISKTENLDDLKKTKTKTKIHSDYITKLNKDSLVPDKAMFIHYFEDSTKLYWFQFLNGLESKHSYVLYSSPVKNGLTFNDQKRNVNIGNPKRLKFQVIYSPFIVKRNEYVGNIWGEDGNLLESDYYIDDIFYYWSRGIGISYRIVKRQNGFPIDININASTLRSYISKINYEYYYNEETENYQTITVSPNWYFPVETSLNVELLKRRSYRLHVGPCLQYEPWYDEFNLGLLGDFVFSTRSQSEFGARIQFYFNKRSYDPSSTNDLYNNKIQPASLGLLFFYQI
jgi:hypothetical protein